MEIKRIIVCGDSFCSASSNNRFHFSHILSNRGYDVINLARGGISNSAICFQLNQAINLSPDLIIYRMTESDRLDVPVKKFNPSLGLKNFIYPFEADASSVSPHVGTVETGTILSDTIRGLLREKRQNSLPKNLQLSNEIKNSIKDYLIYLHDNELQLKKDTWMIGYWENEIEKKNIPSLKLSQHGIGKEIYQYIRENPNKVEQTVYHTDSQTQEIVAESIIQQIQQIKKI
jgi:hypothetical protein